MKISARKVSVFHQWLVISFWQLTFFIKLGVSNDPMYNGFGYSSNLPSKVMPQILSHEQIIRVRQGHSVVLPCKVANLDTYVLMWKQASRVLSAGNLVVRKDPRLSIREDFSLEMANVTPDDQGAYTCEIDVMGKIISIQHMVEVLVPPAVQATPPTDKITIRKGKDFTLRCAAKGNPNPTITWTKENGGLPNGKQSEEGLSLELRHVQRDDAGVYLCTANNGVGPPASAKIEVEIKYPPEIEIEQSWYQPSGEKSVEVELLCTAHANPEAEISWYRSQKKLQENDRQLFQNRAGGLRLSIRNIREEDFGNYSCKAENALGKARAYTSLSGRPRPPRFTSEAIGHKPYTYNVTWTTDSYAPVTEYKLFYRQSDGMPFAQTDNFQELTGTWEKVFIPVIEPVNSFTSKATYTLKHIQPGAVYEILATAKNIHGWSDYSNIFNFFNKGVDYSTQQLSAVSDGNDDDSSFSQSSNLRSDSKNPQEISSNLSSSSSTSTRLDSFETLIICAALTLTGLNIEMKH